jgi:ubiquinone/menaquinone biosynthesis C-methylase UbiE
MFCGFFTIGRSYHSDMGWFRKTAARDSLAVAMAGVKLGDRFLSVGVRDTKLVAALAAKAGLTGRACATDADPARASSAAAAIEAEGALVEVVHAPWGTLPYDAASFDVVLLRDVLSTLTPEEKTHMADDVLRVLRGGGRAIVVEAAKVAADSLTTPLKGAGFAGVRVLAEAEGAIFVEGIKRA